MSIDAESMLDVKDPRGVWLNGIVIERRGSALLIHYTGYSSKFDQWIDDKSPRVQRQWPGIGPIRINNRVDAFNFSAGWLQALVVDIDKDNPKRIKIHYIGYKNSYDEWKTLESDQVEVIGKKSKAMGIGKTHHQNSQLQKKILQEFRKRVKAKLQIASQNLKSIGLRVVIMEGDGNCLFRAFSHQLYGTQSHHAYLRTISLDYISSQRNFFKDYIADDIDEYVTRKKRLGEWGDDVQIQALSQIYDLPVQIYTVVLKPSKTFHQHNPNRKKTIRLQFVGNCHYNSILSQGQSPFISKPFGVYQQTCGFLKSKHGRLQKSVIESRAEFQRVDFQKLLEESVRLQDQRQLLQIQQRQILDLVARESQAQLISEQIKKIDKLQAQEQQRLMRLSKTEYLLSQPVCKDLIQLGYPQWAIVMGVQRVGMSAEAIIEFIQTNLR